jgi:hypothetical protein
VAEDLQPKLMQLQLNYGDMIVAEQKADALRRTIAYYSD